MAATRIFEMDNPKDICTAAALRWVHIKLSGQPVQANQFDGKDPTLVSIMKDIGSVDHNPTLQASYAGLETVTVLEQNRTSNQIAEMFKDDIQHIGLVWNAYHTCAYQYVSHKKSFFDNNRGLWEAKYTADIVTEMDTSLGGPNLQWAGCYSVKLLGLSKVM